MDTLVIGLWVALDPFERHLYNLVRVVSSLDRSVVYQPQVYGSFLGGFCLTSNFNLSRYTFPGRSVSFQQVFHVVGNPLRQKRATSNRWSLHGLGNEASLNQKQFKSFN